MYVREWGACMCSVYIWWAYLWVCRGQRMASGVLLCYFSAYPFETRSLIEMGARLVVAKSQQSFCLCPFQGWGYRNACGHTLLFASLLRLNSGARACSTNSFTFWVPSPAPALLSTGILLEEELLSRPGHLDEPPKQLTVAEGNCFWI